MDEITEKRIEKLTAVGFTKEQAEVIIEIIRQMALSGGVF